MGRRTGGLEASNALSGIDTSLMDKVNLQDRVYLTLRNALIRGRFEPGAQLTIRVLAKALGTSIVPVRDALQRLVAERALELRGNRSASVPVIDRKQFAELTRIRLLLEGEAMRSIPLPLRPHQLDELELANHKIELAVNRGDGEAVTDSNMEFHFMLYRLAGGEMLYGMIETLWVRAGPLLRIPYRAETNDPTVFVSGLDRHKEILAALRKNDNELAERALLRDISDTAHWYQEHIVAGQQTEVQQSAARDL